MVGVLWSCVLNWMCLVVLRFVCRWNVVCGLFGVVFE